jgi:hypothetical protein
MAIQKKRGSALHGGGKVDEYIDTARNAIKSVDDIVGLIQVIMMIVKELKSDLTSSKAEAPKEEAPKEVPTRQSRPQEQPKEAKEQAKEARKARYEQYKQQQGSGMKPLNPWMAHVAKVRSENPSVPYKDILALAKKSYVKGSGCGDGKCGGAVGFATTLAIASAAKAIAPPLERILKDSGILNFYSNISGSVAKRFSDAISDPSRSREKNIIVNVIPKLVRQYEKLENIEKAKKITKQRQQQIDFKKLEIASKIKQKMSQVQGIRQIRGLFDEKSSYIEGRSSTQE